MTPTLGGTINATFLAEYDATVQAALSVSTRPYVIIDLVRVSNRLLVVLLIWHRLPAQLRAVERRYYWSRWTDQRPVCQHLVSARHQIRGYPEDHRES